MRSSRILAIVAVLLSLSGLRCTPPQPSKGTTTTAANDTKGAAEIHVFFQGMIAHNVQKKPLRALLIDTTPKDPSDLPHETLMTIPAIDKNNEALLKKQVIKTQPWTDCSSGCTVNIDGLGVRFVDAAKNPLGPSFTAPSLKGVVPSLQAGTSPGATFNLTDDATSDYPPIPKTGTRKIAAWVELDGGTLSVWDTFACKARFEEIEDNGQLRPWAKTLRLKSTSPDTIQMQINNGRKWGDPIVFADSTVHIDVFISNAPRKANGRSHFLMYGILSQPSESQPLAKLNNVVEEAGCNKKGDRDIVAGCSNSTWP